MFLFWLLNNGSVLFYIFSITNVTAITSTEITDTTASKSGQHDYITIMYRVWFSSDLTNIPTATPEENPTTMTISNDTTATDMRTSKSTNNI